MAKQITVSGEKAPKGAQMGAGTGLGRFRIPARVNDFETLTEVNLV